MTLAGTIHETVVAGIREEVRQEFRAMLDEKDAMLSEKDAPQPYSGGCRG